MRVVRKRFHPIYQDYREDNSRIRDLYHYHPLSFYEKREELLSSYTFQREVLVHTLTEYNKSMGANKETLSSISKLFDPCTMAIVSGQQAGLLTGPLYTIYKAISLLQMVERLENEGIVAVPIFWVASEDHDFDEINHIYFLDKTNGLTSLHLKEEKRGASIGTRPISREEAQELLLELSQKTPQTEFKEEVIDMLQSTLQASTTLVEWFSRLLLALFSKRGLILFDPLIEDLKEWKRPFFKELYSKRHLLERALDRGEEIIQKKGYPLQVKREKGRLPFFINHQQRRTALFEGEEGFKTRGGELLYSFSQLERLLETEPERFTSTVLTRPLLQGYLLPTLIYIAGPAELAYHGQIKEAYPLMGQRSPLLHLRLGMTIVEGRVLEHMEEYNLRLPEVLEGLERELEERLKDRTPLHIEGLFGTIKKEWRQEYKVLIEELKRVNPQLELLGEKNLQRILKEVEYLENKTWQFHKRRETVLQGHFQRIEDSLRPRGDLQERSLNLFFLLIKYGTSFLQEIDRGASLTEEHSILYYRGD